MIAFRERIITGVSWSGVFLGLIVGLVAYIVLTMLGLAIGGAVFGFDAVSELAWGALIWLAVSFAIAAFMGGFFGTRGAPGLATRRAGGYIGTVTGGLFLLMMTLFTINSLTSIGRAAFGAAQGAVSNLPDVNLQQAGQALGIEQELQGVLAGLDRAEIERQIAEASPDLSQQQVSSAASVILTTISNSVTQIAGSLDDITRLDQVISEQGDILYGELTGQKFVQTLQQQGLSPMQANNVANAFEPRAQQLRDQLRETSGRLATQAEQLSQNLAEGLSRAAWSWLAVAAIVLLFSIWGGLSGSDRRQLRELREREEMPERPEERIEYPQHH